MNDLLPRASQCGEQLPARGVPQPCGVILRGGGQAVAIRTEGHVQDQVIADGIAENRDGPTGSDLIDNDLLPGLGNPCFSRFDAWHSCSSSCIKNFLLM